MRIIGKLARYLLNINTIWGLMILGSFALCVIQQYQPTSTAIGENVLQCGTNTVSIQLTGHDGDVQQFDYELQLENGTLAIAEPDRKPSNDHPWLIDARRVGVGYILKWDADAHGAYVVAVNGQVIRKGSLVTLRSLTDAAFDYAQIGFDIALGLVATMVLFLGLMKVGEAAGIVQLIAKAFYPIIRFLFPQVPKDHPALGTILMNVTSTLLGLGNAATPFGLKAMKELEELNPNPGVATDAQVMLLAYNTAGFALLPTTLLALRKSAGCADPFEIIGTCMVAGATAAVVAIISAKTLGRLPFFTTRAAVAEQASELGGSQGANADQEEE